MAAPNLVRLNLGESAPILRDTRLSSGELATSVVGLPGIYPVEASSDLEHWQPAGQVRLEGDGREAEVHAPTAPDSAQFIRLRSPTP